MWERCKRNVYERINKLRINNHRILISHCKDDNRIPFQNLIQTQDHLGLDEKNVIKFNNGGHSFKGHREEIFKYSLEFLKRL